MIATCTGTSRFAVAALAAALFALTLGAGPAGATAEVGFGVFGGYQSYSMSDVNDEVVDPINVALAGSGLSMDEISGGVGFGGGVRVRTSSGLLISVDYARLNASSDLSGPGGNFEVDVPANAFNGTVVYLFPSAGKARFGLGGGLGYYSAAATASLYDASTSTTDVVDLDGSGVGFHGLGMVDFSLSPQVHGEAGVGYRYAKTSDLEVDGVKVVNSSGDDATLDWSGLLTRVGITVYFGNQ